MTWKKPTSPSRHLHPVRVHNPRLMPHPALLPQPCKDTLRPPHSSYCSRLAATRRLHSTPLLWHSCTCWLSARPWVQWAHENISSRTRLACSLPLCRPHRSRLSPVWRLGCVACPCRDPSPCRLAWRQNRDPVWAWLTQIATLAHTTASQPDVSTGDARRGRADRTRCPLPSSPPPRRHPPSARGIDFLNRRPTAEQIHQRS